MADLSWEIDTDGRVTEPTDRALSNAEQRVEGSIDPRPMVVAQYLATVQSSEPVDPSLRGTIPEDVWSDPQWGLAVNAAQPGPPGAGTLLPGIPAIPNLRTVPSLGTAVVPVRSMIVDDRDWNDGLYEPGKIVFTEPENRQRSGVRFGWLPMVVFQDEPTRGEMA